MISTINIKNIGIIDDLSIDLNQGFNVLTGETGAGKTLIIDSLRNNIRRQIFKRNDKKRRRSLIYRSMYILARK
ncbi:MAG: AAA family ATPase [Clostridia bacterium]|nr:AAA family ATPase [Clostridia bacterium]